MHSSNCKTSKTRLIALTVATSAVLAISAQAHDSHHDSHHHHRHHGISQSGEQKNMERVGHVDLQGRSAYQPNVIEYPDGRTIAFAGMHGGSAPNPLQPGSPVERNGVMIIDATNPHHPVETFLIPSPGQSQMVRPCLASDLTHNSSDNRVFLLRNDQSNDAAISGFELWDVTNIYNPMPVYTLTGIRNTHKLWWECTTGIMFAPGSRNDMPPDKTWRQAQSMVIYDWTPTILDGGVTAPTYIRTFGLPGGQPEPEGSGPVPPSLHGPISAYEHPMADQPLAGGAGPDNMNVIGNRIYAAYGVGSNGVLQILDRNKLLDVSSVDPDLPTNEDLLKPQVGILYMSPDQGGHTSFPIFGLQPKSYQNFARFKTRDIVMLASESTANLCNEAPHWSFVVDVTTENSGLPPADQARQNLWAGPMVLSTLSVDPRRGEKYPRGNYCIRGARFGVHSSEENFNNPCYGGVTFTAYFTGGVRAWDIREPQAPVEVGFYVPEANANTAASGYMTNNVEVDNRGYIYVTDRGQSGLDIIKLTDEASKICFANSRDRYYYDNDNYDDDDYDHRKHH